MSAQTKANRGGTRKGAGRKPGKKVKRMTFTIPITTAEALSELARNKSRFVAEAIMKAIESL